MTIVRFYFIVFLLFLGGTASAHEYFAGNFKLVHPWSEASNPGVTEADVYCIFEDVRQDDKLLSAKSSMAESIEIRKSASSPGRQWEVLEVLEIPSNAVLQLSKASVYLAIVGLRAPLQWGRSYPMQMQFERAGIVNVMVSIGAH